MARKKRIKKIIIRITLPLLAAWVLICQFSMQDRIPDDTLKKKFQEKNLVLITGYRKVKGSPIHFAKTGSDSLPTLVFIHGTPGSLSAFQRYLQDSQLLKKYRLIAIDRPGFGYSDFGNTMNLENQSNHISGLIDSLSNQKPVYLIGHSYGGPLIIKLASINSQINGIVILAGSVDPQQEISRWWRPIITYTPLRWLVPVAWRYSNEEQYWLKDDLVKLKVDFPKVICPVFIFHGDKDKNVPLENTEYAKRMLANSQKVSTTIFQGTNHFIVWSKYEEIKKCLLNLP